MSILCTFVLFFYFPISYSYSLDQENKIFHDELKRFQLEHPSDWIPIKINNNSVLFEKAVSILKINNNSVLFEKAVSIPDNSRGYRVVFGVVVENLNNNNTSLLSYSDLHFEQLLNYSKIQKFEEIKTDFKLNSNPAFNIKFTNINNQVISQIWTIKNNHVFILTYSTDPHIDDMHFIYDLNLPAVNKMVDSFKILS